MILAMDDATLANRLQAGMKHFYRVLGSASPSARVVEADGVLACFVPVARERSYPNAVLYDDATALARAYPALEAAYAEAGVRAWTVWVPAGDEQAIGFLRMRGHVHDAAPTAMARELTGVARPPAGTLDEWTSAGDPATLGVLNDRAYAFGDRAFEQAYANAHSADSRVYVGSVGGTAVTCLCASWHDANCAIDAVATTPEARGSGLSGQLLAHALVDAAESGATTTTLIATALGRPVYERAGYRSIGTREMWERRAR